MIHKIFIIIQGPIEHYSDIHEAYSKLNIIWSSWENYKEVLRSETNVIINKNPFIVGNFNFFLQQKSTYAGLLEAKRLGATHVMKLRADMIFSDLDLLIQLMMKNPDGMYFPSWHNFKGGYFMDFFQFGPIDSMIKLWNIRPTILDLGYKFYLTKKIIKKIFPDARIPEKVMTASFFKNFPKSKVKYILPLLKEHKIKCRWLKHQNDFDNFINDHLCDINMYT